MSQKISIKQFWTELKTAIKNRYWTAVWPIAGGMLLLLAVSVLLSLGIARSFMTFMMMFQMMMYGMSSLSMALMVMVGLWLLIACLVVVEFFLQFVGVSSAYAWLDYLRHSEMKMNASNIWTYFKHLKKNQILRLTLYMSFFICLWQLPLMIISSLPVIAKISWLTMALKIINEVIVIWKSIEYSQAIFTYRDRQADFLGQSMRHAITASRRLMGGFKASYLLVAILFIVLPMLVLGAIFGGIAFYGDYTGTYPVMWIGIILLIVAELMFIPVALLVAAQFYQQITSEKLLDDSFADTFKPVSVLNGQQFANDWQGPRDTKSASKQSADPQVKPAKQKKNEAKKDE